VGHLWKRRRVRSESRRGFHRDLRPAPPQPVADPGALGARQRGDARDPEDRRDARQEGPQANMSDLWKGRFATGLDPQIRAFTASLELDKRIALHDVRGSIAHARMLGRQAILSKADAATLVAGLEASAEELRAGAFPWPPAPED